MEHQTKVRVFEENITIPTYKVYSAEKNPLFIEKRAYQGSTGKVYPLPVTEKISDTAQDVTYKAVFLENEYLQVMILPEIGGRIQRAFDKTNGYDFVYYNHVIKPALVGLTGPWISGGIEFNWPQHHRPSTYSPVDYTLAENPDGSCTVFLSEIDKMYGTKGMACISLYPGKAYIEIKGKLFNNTELPQTFLWWANPAVPVNDHTYSVFPPDVNAVMDHGKRAVSTFPIATGEYYKYDYSAGVDISRYRNVKVPTSYMAAHSDFDFIGNYDEKLQAGLLHVADHHISPGKKQWTWGNGDFGRSWDRNLTDEDGPYIELMTGVFTDNQPDFTWLKPYEEKNFTQYFMPYKGVGRVSNATKDAAVSLSENGDGSARLRVYATGRYENARIAVTRRAAGEVPSPLFDAVVTLTPESFYEADFPGSIADCRVTVSARDKILVEYDVYEPELAPVPSPAEPMKAPEEMKSTEELYLAASHLEQYRHATFEPSDYYLEGLRRDASDIRLNNGYGLLLLKRGRAFESIPYFQAAIKKQTWKNPNPYYGESYFNLGLALTEAAARTKSCGENMSCKERSLLSQAYDAFYKAVWSGETKSAAFYQLACLASRRGEYAQALDFLEQSLTGSWHNMKARTLKAALLRKQQMENSSWIADSLSIDPLYMGCLYEKAIGSNETGAWKAKMRGEAHNYLELALIYGHAGLYEDAISILEACSASHPLVYYYLGYYHDLYGETTKASSLFEKAESIAPDYCFPNRNMEIYILEAAVRILPHAPMAHYYLGNLLYDKKQYEEAVSHWEQAVLEKPELSPAYRNLSIAYYNKHQDYAGAMKAMKKALQLDKTYPRLLLEYDQLAAKTQVPFSERLALLEANKEITSQRDDLYLRFITLLNCSGRHEEARNALLEHSFHPWEGGEGKTSTQYRYALIHLAGKALAENRNEDALQLLTDTLTYPHNLGEGKLPNVNDNEAHYYMGVAYAQMGDMEKAHSYWKLAASGPCRPEPVLYYNDQPSDYIFYQGLACLRMGKQNEAAGSFHRLLSYGEKHLFDQVSYDFFAVSLPEIEVYQDDLVLRNTQYCNYLMALGSLGLGLLAREQAPHSSACADTHIGRAEKLFHTILAKQDDYQGALSHLAMTK